MLAVIFGMFIMFVGLMIVMVVVEKHDYNKWIKKNREKSALKKMWEMKECT